MPKSNTIVIKKKKDKISLLHLILCVIHLNFSADLRSVLGGMWETESRRQTLGLAVSVSAARNTDAVQSNTVYSLVVECHYRSIRQ